MTELYRSFAELADATTPGADYRVVLENRNSHALIIAPHGGSIEKGTSEITRHIAGKSLSFYLFEGCRVCGNRELHITSHHFDESRAISLVKTHLFAVGVHGRQDGDYPDTVWIGGLDRDLAELLESEFAISGFMSRIDGHRIPAQNKKNICNRGKSGKGAQLELPLSLRNRLLGDLNLMRLFAVAVRKAVMARLANYGLRNDA